MANASVYQTSTNSAVLLGQRHSRGTRNFLVTSGGPPPNTVTIVSDPDDHAPVNVTMTGAPPPFDEKTPISERFSRSSLHLRSTRSLSNPARYGRSMLVSSRPCRRKMHGASATGRTDGSRPHFSTLRRAGPSSSQHRIEQSKLET